MSRVVPEYESSRMMISAQMLTGQRVVAVRHCVNVAFLTPFFCLRNFRETLSARWSIPLSWESSQFCGSSDLDLSSVVRFRNYIQITWGDPTRAEDNHCDIIRCLSATKPVRHNQETHPSERGYTFYRKCRELSHDSGILHLADKVSLKLRTQKNGVKNATVT